MAPNMRQSPMMPRSMPEAYPKAPARSRAPGDLLKRLALDAVDGEADAGDPARRGGEEEGGGRRHLLGSTEAAEGELTADEVGDPVGVGGLSAGPAAAWEEDRARGEAVHADAVLREIAGHGLGQADLGGL